MQSVNYVTPVPPGKKPDLQAAIEGSYPRRETPLAVTPLGAQPGGINPSEHLLRDVLSISPLPTILFDKLIGTTLP